MKQMRQLIHLKLAVGRFKCAGLVYFWGGFEIVLS